jgi:hypothetical protein
LSDTGNLERLNASATACCGKFAAAHAAQRKRTFSLKKSLQLLPSRRQICMRSISYKEPVDLVTAQVCLEEPFPDERARPSLRWFLGLKAAGMVPFRKIGRLVFYDVTEVRRALDRKFKVETPL